MKLFFKYFFWLYYSQVAHFKIWIDKSLHYTIKKKQRSMEQNTSNEASCRSSLDHFTVIVIIAWLIICLPGNIFPILCIYGTNDTDISSFNQKQPNYSWKHFTNNSSRAQQNITNLFWNQSSIRRDLKIDPESVSIFFINNLSMK